VLEGLDALRWHELHHAYGAANDIPGLLRDLAAGNDATRERAIDELFGSLDHQGTVYEASAAAVPFLVEIAVDHRTPLRWRAWVLILLAGLADGNDVSDARYVVAARTAVANQLAILLPLMDERGLDVAMAWIAGNCGRDGGQMVSRLGKLERYEPPGARRLAFAIARGLIEAGGATPDELAEAERLSADFAEARQGTEPSDSKSALEEVAGVVLKQYLR
jgi:hypothetical protein